LAAYLAALAGTRTPLWGGAAGDPPAPPSSTHAAIVLLVNARVVPNRETLVTLRTIVESGRRGIVPSESGFAAAVLHATAEGAGGDRAIVDRLAPWSTAGGPPPLDADAVAALVAERLAGATIEASLDMISMPHEILAAHERAVEDSLAMRIDSGRFRERRPGLFVAAGADVAAEVVVRHGPVVVDEGASIGPFVCLDGPIWIGRGVRVNPHAWIRAATSVGHDCRIGGEVEATVMEPFSNKAHGGFLGHSHVGSWVNIAAGTVTSNLKATYGPVRLHRPRPDGGRDTTHTNRQFMGALVGELVRTGINASIPCGARIGVAAAVGGDVAEQVPAFTNQIVGGPPGERSTAEQAAIVLGRMMARRGLDLQEADRRLLEQVRSLPDL
ncbi:MAG: hypothetical protein EBZ59_11475, partial [Planctomycetia bacterium]|nr:hypothetical protein [Planctomycetia bacterium]